MCVYVVQMCGVHMYMHSRCMCAVCVCVHGADVCVTHVPYAAWRVRVHC